MMDESATIPTMTDEAFVERLGPLLRTLSHRMRQHLSEASCGVGLPVPLAMALRDLDPDHPRPMHELADALRCDPSHVTGIADRLERLGLVARQPGLYDRRVKELRVTAAGRQRRSDFIARLTRVPLAIESLAETERMSLIAMLEQILAVVPPAMVDGIADCPSGAVDEVTGGGAVLDCPGGAADQFSTPMSSECQGRGRS